MKKLLLTTLTVLSLYAPSAFCAERKTQVTLEEFDKQAQIDMKKIVKHTEYSFEKFTIGSLEIAARKKTLAKTATSKDNSSLSFALMMEKFLLDPEFLRTRYTELLRILPQLLENDFSQNKEVENKNPELEKMIMEYNAAKRILVMQDLCQQGAQKQQPFFTRLLIRTGLMKAKL